MNNITNLTDKEYRALPLESFSSLKAILSSVKEFLHYKENPFTGNASTTLGTAVHHYLQNNQHLVFVNDFSRTTKEGKAKFEEFITNLPNDGVIITLKQKETLDIIYKHFLEAKKCVDILKGCVFEVAHVFKVEVDGIEIEFKGKVDAVNVEEGYIVEIKTSGAFYNIDEFREGSKQMHYDMQAALYCYMMEDLYKKPFKHWFIVANTKAPFTVERYKTSTEYLNQGIKKAKEAFKKYKKHIIDQIPEDDSEVEL